MAKNRKKKLERRANRDVRKTLDKDGGQKEVQSSLSREAILRQAIQSEKEELDKFSVNAGASGSHVASVIARKEEDTQEKKALSVTINSKKQKKVKRKTSLQTSSGQTQDEVPVFPNIDEADHCETPLIAYEDLEPFLQQLAHRLGKPKSDLRIYDPYFCTGKMKVFFVVVEL